MLAPTNVAPPIVIIVRQFIAHFAVLVVHTLRKGQTCIGPVKTVCKDALVSMLIWVPRAALSLHLSIHACTDWKRIFSFLNFSVNRTLVVVAFSSCVRRG